MTGRIQFGRLAFAYAATHVARKTMEIAVHPDGRVVVKAPLGTDRYEIEARLRKRAPWVLRQIDYFQQFEPRTPARHFVSGETHLYLGRQCRLKVVRSDVDLVKMRRGVIIVGIAGDASPSKVAAHLERWYRARARQYLQERLELCAQHVMRKGQALPRLQIRKMKSRWGSLSKRETLTLNLSLIQTPRDCIDYVITHELCHLRFDDHSPAFYRNLEKAMPDWEKRKRRLELTLA